MAPVLQQLHLMYIFTPVGSVVAVLDHVNLHLVLILYISMTHELAFTHAHSDAQAQTQQHTSMPICAT